MTATPPRADLRTLATEGDAPMTDQVAPSPQSLCDHPVYVHHVRGGEPLTIPLCRICGEIGWNDLREQVAEHRRMVLAEAADERQKAAELTGWFLSNDDLRQRERAAFERGRVAALGEAAEAIETDAADLGSAGHTAVEQAYLAAAGMVRRLAAAAPPAGLSAPVPAENASAVPEEAAKAQRRPPPPECELPTPGGNWCARPIGHDGPCSPTRRLKPPEDTSGGFHEPDEPTDHIAAVFDVGTHGRTAPPRGQTRRLDVAADDAQETIRRLTAERDTLKAFVNPAEHVRKMRQENDRQRSEFIEKLMLEVVEERTRAEKAEADRDRLAAQVERVRALHKPELFAGVQACLACSPGMPPPTLIEWPCPTIAAVDALPDAPATDGQDGDGRG